MTREDIQQAHGDFVALCTQLRLLGAVEVTAGALHAKFEGRARVAPPQPAEEPESERVPLTPEQAREAQRARDLGRAPPKFF